MPDDLIEEKDTLPCEEPFAKIDQKMHLILKTGQILIESGADTDRTTRDMRRVAAFLGIPPEKMHLHVMYTTLMLNVHDREHTYTEFCKCRRHGINMEALSAVSKLTWHAIFRNYNMEQFSRRLRRIEDRPRNYSTLVTAIGAGVACGGFCKLFGGDWLDFVLTSLCAFLGFYVRRFCLQYEFNSYAAIAIASFASTMAAWSTQFLTGTMNWYPLIACALFIVPGIPLINSIDDFLNHFVIIGMARAIDTLLIVGSMTFGIVIAIRLGGVTDFTSVSLTPDTIYFSQVIAAAVSAMGFSIIFNIPKRMLPVVAVGGIITVMTRNIAVMGFGASTAAGTFLGACIVGILGFWAMHWFHAPGILMTIPSSIPMVPGVMLYRLLFALLNLQFITTSTFFTGLQSGVMGIMAVAGIAIGVAMPTIFIRGFINRRKYQEAHVVLCKRWPYWHKYEPLK